MYARPRHVSFSDTLYTGLYLEEVIVFKFTPPKIKLEKKSRISYVGSCNLSYIFRAVKRNLGCNECPSAKYKSLLTFMNHVLLVSLFYVHYYNAGDTPLAFSRNNTTFILNFVLIVAEIKFMSFQYCCSLFIFRNMEALNIKATQTLTSVLTLLISQITCKTVKQPHMCLD